MTKPSPWQKKAEGNAFGIYIMNGKTEGERGCGWLRNRWCFQVSVKEILCLCTWVSFDCAPQSMESLVESGWCFEVTDSQILFNHLFFSLVFDHEFEANRVLFAIVVLLVSRGISSRCHFPV